MQMNYLAREKNIRFENAIETHLTCIMSSVIGHLTAKVIFMCTMLSCAALYQQKVSLMETSLVGKCLYCFMQILEYSHENLSQIGWKPSYQNHITFYWSHTHI